MSKSSPHSRRTRRGQGRRIRVFADSNRALRPEHLARVMTIAGLEQARREAAARADNEAQEAERTPPMGAEEQEGDHA